MIMMIICRYEIDMTCPDNTTRGVYRGRDTECVVASLLPGRPYMFQVSYQCIRDSSGISKLPFTLYKQPYLW